jgi:histidinol-phosphate phosphatase family protein
MHPITEEIPKCLIDINGKPLIQHQLEFFRKHGYRDIIFCIAHLADKVKAYFKNGSSFNMNISYVQETEELMGTAGSVKLVENLMGNDEDFIVYYGDNLTSMDFKKFLAFHKNKNALATICMRPLPDGYKSTSVITLDINSKIQVFLEKPPMEEIEKYKDQKRYINSGIYAFKKDIFRLIPENKKYDFAKEVFPYITQNNLGMYGYVTNEFFKEIGRVEKYNQFLEDFKDRRDFLFNPENRGKRKAIFMDRDGVINVNASRLSNPDNLVLLPNVAEAIRKINSSGYLAIIATNQPDVSKGYYTFDDLNKVHERMLELIAEKGAHIDDIYICPHHPEKGFPGEVPELKIDCDCRKPKPGLLSKAIKEYGINPEKSWMMGDSSTDIIAGQRAGVSTILIEGLGSGSKESLLYKDAKPDYSAKHLFEAVDFILSLDIK